MHRILLADDHPIILDGLCKLLEPDYQVVGTALDGTSLLQAALASEPDLVITDLSMPGLDGVEVSRRLSQTLPGVRILIFSVHNEPSWVRAAFEAGACGYLTKASAPEEIETAIQEVLAGRFYVSPSVARAALSPATSLAPDDVRACRKELEAIDVLTPRERSIFDLLAEGLCNKDIARRLGVSVTTVRTHLHSVYDKLGIESRIELALLAAQPDFADA